MSGFEQFVIGDGRYRLVRLLGSGGMARVFLAEDTTLDVQRAIKLLSPDIAKEALIRKRLYDEAKVMANLIHPNIVTVHDIVDTVVPYIVMEYLSGGSLLDLLEQNGPLSSDQAAQLLVPVCEAVHFAHKSGVVHRDIKPHNILLTHDGRTKITDFGIARVTSQFSQTKTGDIIGTPSYMSPEQRLSARRVTEKSDIYSIGATFFVLLCGGNPSELFDDVLAHELLKGLPEESHEIILKACAFKPEERYESAIELATALSKLIQNGSIPRTVSQPEQPDEAVKKMWLEYTNDDVVPVSSFSNVESAETLRIDSDESATVSELLEQKPVLALEVELDSLDLRESEKKHSKPAPFLLSDPPEQESSDFNVGLSGNSDVSSERNEDGGMEIAKASSGETKTTPEQTASGKGWVLAVAIVLISLVVHLISPRLDLSLAVLQALNTLSLCSGVAGLTALVLGGGRVVERRWSEEFVWTGVALFLMATLGVFFSAPQLLGMPFFETDFIDYCVGVANFDSPQLAPPKRANVAAWLPATLARTLGVIDGLSWASLISCALTGLGVHLWARAVGGRLAGIYALCLALALAPIVGLGRFLNFYPEIIATFTLAAAAVAIAIRTRHAGAVLVAGALSCLCVLVDLRGLIWFLPLSFGVLIAIIGMPTIKDKISSLCGLVGVYVFSWRLGRWSYHELATPLERQIDVRPLFAAFDPQTFSPPYSIPSEFVWGRSSIVEIPQTLKFLWQQRSIEPPVGFLSADTGMTMLQPYANGWGVCLGLGVMLSLLFYKRYRWRLFALCLPCLPFAVALLGSKELVEPHLRFFSHALPGVVVVLGVAMAGLVRKLQAFGGRSQRKPAVQMTGVVILSAVLWGLTLKPLVNWHPQWPIQRHIYLSVMEKAFPERSGYFRMQPASVGRENHVHVLPLTQAERDLARNYDVECAIRLNQDQTLYPALFPPPR